MGRIGSLGFFMVLTAVAVACDNNGGTDAGPPDGGAQDSGPPPTPGVEVGTLFDDMENPIDFAPADFSCRGTRMAPSATGNASSFTLTAEDFMSGLPVSGLMVEFFPNNMATAPGSPCSDPLLCQPLTTDASGQEMVDGTEGAWYAYRVAAGQAGNLSNYIDVVQFNEVTPADGGDATLNVVSENTRTLILGLLGATQEAGTTTVTGQLTDCMDRKVANARVRLFDSSGAEIPLATIGQTAAREFYFSYNNGDSLPLASQRNTNFDGLYGAMNVPLPSDGIIRIELWGALTDGGTPEMLGCEQVTATPDSLTIMNVGPDRADGPTGCSM